MILRGFKVCSVDGKDEVSASWRYLTTQPLFVCDTPQPRQDVSPLLGVVLHNPISSGCTIIPININRSLLQRRVLQMLSTDIHTYAYIIGVSVLEVLVYAGFLSLLCKSSITPSG